MTTAKKVLLSASSLLMLAACSSTWDVEGVRNMEAKGTLFDKALKHEYTEIAAQERAQGDWESAAVFLARARAAATGQPHAVEGISERKIAEDKTSDVAEARARLERVLNSGARNRTPEEAATAQTSYECWTEQLEEGHQKEDIAACRKAFDDSMNAMERGNMVKDAITAAKEYVLYFAFGKATIRDTEKTKIRMASQDYKENRPAQVMVSGHADRAGSDQVNALLSRLRAKAVSAELKQNGVPEKAITVRSFGEYQTAIKTADGVAEQKNRRVVISFSDK